MRTTCVARGVYGVPLVCGRWRRRLVQAKVAAQLGANKGFASLINPCIPERKWHPFQTSSTVICSAIPNRAHQVFRRHSHVGRCVFSSRFGPKLEVDQQSSREPQVARGALRTRELCTAAFQVYAFPMLPKETSHLLSRRLCYRSRPRRSLRTSSSLPAHAAPRTEGSLFNQKLSRNNTLSRRKALCWKRSTLRYVKFGANRSLRRYRAARTGKPRDLKGFATV